jgi:hypothetical protein
MLRELDQDASRGRRVQKRDSLALGADARALVNQSQTRIAAFAQRPVQIVDRKTNVMDSGTAPLEEPGNRRSVLSASGAPQVPRRPRSH